MSDLITQIADWLKRYVVVLAFLSIAALWLYSHLFVPLALVVFAVLLLSTADIEFTIPGFGTVKRKREGQEAAKVLKQETETLDQRGEAYLETLLPAEAPPNPPPPEPSE